MKLRGWVVLKDLLKREILFIVSPAQRWETQALLEYCFAEEAGYFPRTDMAKNSYTIKRNFSKKSQPFLICNTFLNTAVNKLWRIYSEIKQIQRDLCLPLHAYFMRKIRSSKCAPSSCDSPFLHLYCSSIYCCNGVKRLLYCLYWERNLSVFV